MLHIFDGGIDWQSPDKDLLCPGHQLATQKKKASFTTNHIRQGVDVCDKETCVCWCLSYLRGFWKRSIQPISFQFNVCDIQGYLGVGTGEYCV